MPTNTISTFSKTLLCCLCIITMTVSNGLTEQQAQRQIQSIYRQLQPGQGPNTQQRQRIRQHLQQWGQHLNYHNLNSSTITFDQFTNAMKAWHRWSRAVSSLHFSNDFPNANQLPPKLLSLIEPLTTKLYRQCIDQHDIKQLHSLMSLLKLLSTFELNQKINQVNIQQKIENCGQFELKFKSALTWVTPMQFNMTTSATVPFKISFTKKENLGKSTLQYDHFNIIDHTGNPCSIKPVRTENGTLAITDFSFEHNRYSITLLPAPLWESWTFTAPCEYKKIARGSNFIATWYTFHQNNITNTSGKPKGYVIKDFIKGKNAIIATKLIQRQRHVPYSPLPLKEMTSITIHHKPKLTSLNQ